MTTAAQTSVAINPQTRYLSQDILVNSTGQSTLNRRYREVNTPRHVEPAARLQLSPETLEYRQRWQK